MQILKAKTGASNRGRASADEVITPAVPERAKSEPQHPFSIPLFRMLWVATLVSNCGTWMQEVASGWLMTSLAPDPLMVSLVQVATALPMFLLGLPAGVLADLVDKRRWLLGTQTLMMLAATAMALSTAFGFINSWLLLLGSFTLAVGAALNSPGWHSVTPEVVPKDTLQSAVTLNGVVINCARALGPALGGLVVVKLGAGAAFALNALSFLAVLIVLWHWKRDTKTETLPSERFLSALRVGVQHVAHSPLMRLLIVRSGVLVFSTSVAWALLPLLARQEYGFGARGYSMLLVANALGAIVGATLVLPRLRNRWDSNRIVSAAWIGFIPTLIVLSQCEGTILPYLVLLWGGMCNILMLSCFHLAAQSLAPEWVRARAVAVYLLTFSGTTTVGSLFWGSLARGVGLRQTLVWGACFLLLGSVTGWLAPLRTGESFNHEPSNHWPDPHVNLNVPLTHGPIMVTVDYEVYPEDAEEFVEAMQRIRRLRYRGGVMRWSLYEDMEDPNIFHEVYVEENWAAHLRQHERVSCYEEEVAKLAFRFHRGDATPKVRHLAFCERGFPSMMASIKAASQSRRQPVREIPTWFLD